MNSRPLVPISSDPNNVTASTLGHYLIGEHAFWTQWSIDYLQQLQHRQKLRRSSANVKEGELVLIKEDNTPFLQWPLGRIIKIIHGKDNFVRVRLGKLIKSNLLE